MTGGVPEPSLAVELAETKGNHWLTSGWSLDAVATSKRAGLGIAKDIYKKKRLEVDLGAYLTQDYAGLSQGHLAPKIGAGLNIRF